MLRSPLADIALGVWLALVAFGMAVACTSSGQLTPLAECKLDALRVLPPEVDQVTIGDARDIYRRVRACHADAGVP
jgi:hypothetical protein